MKKLVILGIVISLFSVTGLFAAELEQDSGRGKTYYRTFEILEISETGIVIQDLDGNIIVVDKDPKDYKVGYKVRYDSVRKRLRSYRWQEYTVTEVSDKSLTLKHKTGDTVSVSGNYRGKYSVGDQVRYDSVADKLQLDEDADKWQQYTVVAESPDKINIEASDGQQVIVYMDNNLYPERRGVYIAKYKVGDLVRYNAATNKIKKGVKRTYDWQDYTVKEVTRNQILLINENKEEQELENIYGSKFKPGDPVKYDRLNNLLKKVR